MLNNQKITAELEKINLYDLLPHRDPFLFIDQLVSFSENELVSSYLFTDKNNFYQAHFPNFPLTPGVILCEGLMQTGAALLNLNQKFNLPQKNSTELSGNELYVASRIKEVKFKNMVPIDTRVYYHVNLTECLGKAFYFTGKVKSDEGKVFTSMSFTCNLTFPPNLQ
jgi:3-hydroxyacyl-[acyl-carrier-protein] dehydratase